MIYVDRKKIAPLLPVAGDCFGDRAMATVAPPSDKIGDDLFLNLLDEGGQREHLLIDLQTKQAKEAAAKFNGFENMWKELQSAYEEDVNPDRMFQNIFRLITNNKPKENIFFSLIETMHSQIFATHLNTMCEVNL